MVSLASRVVPSESEIVRSERKPLPFTAALPHHKDHSSRRLLLEVLCCVITSILAAYSRKLCLPLSWLAPHRKWVELCGLLMARSSDRP